MASHRLLAHLTALGIVLGACSPAAPASSGTDTESGGASSAGGTTATSAGANGSGTGGVSGTGGLSGSGGVTSTGGASGAGGVISTAGAGSGGAAGSAGSGDTGSAGSAGAAVNPDAKYNHRVLLGSGAGPIAIVSDDGSKFEFQVQYKPLGRPGAETEGNDAALLPNSDVVFTFSAGAEEVKQDGTVVWRWDNPSGTETQGITPLPDGHFMVGETHGGGIAYLRELDAMGKVVNSITVDSGSGAAPHQQFREIRKTPQGTYLVTYLGLEQAREIDATGKTLRKFPCGSFVAVRLPNLNTLIACGNTHRVIEVDPQDKIVWEVNKTNVPIMNGFAAGIQRLPNGNTAMCSFPGDLGRDPGTPRCFEVTPDYKVVWQLKTPKMPDYYWTALEFLDPAAWVGGVPLR